ncbi:Obg-like ATPase 1 [subsurface metagenome]
MVANTGARAAEISELRTEAEVLELGFFSMQGLQEMEIVQLAEEDRREFLEDLGLKEPAKNRFLKQIYASLNLISFLTVNENEVRAWSVPRGSTALEAAGKVHSDMEKGFIRAETIHWQDLLDADGFAPARKSGKLRLEGKSYQVQDGDVLLIRFNI